MMRFFTSIQETLGLPTLLQVHCCILKTGVFLKQSTFVGVKYAGHPKTTSLVVYNDYPGRVNLVILFINMKYKTIVLLVLGVFSIYPNLAWSQNSEDAALREPPAVIRCDNITNTSHLDLRFGSLFGAFETPDESGVYLSDPIEYVDAGSRLEVPGTLGNLSEHPLSDLVIYARVYKYEPENSDSVTQLDEFIVAHNMQLPSKANFPTELLWDVPLATESGRYYINLYARSSSDTYLLNSPYDHLPSKGHVEFVVENGAEANSAPYFDTQATSIEGAWYGPTPATESSVLLYDFINPVLPTAVRGETTFVTSINNPTDTEMEVPVEWKQYAVHSFDQNAVKHTQSQLITVPAQGTATAVFTTREQDESLLYVTAELSHKEAKSLVSLGVQRKSTEDYQIILPTVYPFPAVVGQSTNLHVCAGTLNQAQMTDEVVLLVTAYDRVGEVIHSTVYPSLLTNDLQSFTDTFVAAADYDYIELETVVMRANKIVHSDRQIFNKEAMRMMDPEYEDSTEYEDSIAVAESPSGPTTIEYIKLAASVVGVLLLILIILLVIVVTRGRRTKKSKPTDVHEKNIIEKL
jgi:hypothetical protein